jgi:hypothetical protein
MNGLTLLGTVFGSAVIAALINSVASSLLQSGQGKRRATYTALKAAIALEGFAIQAASNASIADRFDPDGYYDAQEHDTRDWPVFPPAPQFDADLDWRDLKTDLASRCLTFVHEVGRAKDLLAAARSIDSDAWIIELRFQLDQRAKRAAGLAKQVRKAYRLHQLSDADLAMDYSLDHDE